jgi:hypothetical protein
MKLGAVPFSLCLFFCFSFFSLRWPAKKQLSGGDMAHTQADENSPQQFLRVRATFPV